MKKPANDNQAFFLRDKNHALEVLMKLHRDRGWPQPWKPWTKADLKAAGMPVVFIDIAHWYGSLKELKTENNL